MNFQPVTEVACRWRRALWGSVVCAYLIAISLAQVACAQNIAERLQQGVDNPQAAQNQYRGGADDVDGNMKKLFEPIMSGAGGGIDKWYSPHLRDTRINQTNRQKQAKLRSEAGVMRIEPCLLGSIVVGIRCLNGFNVPLTACNIPGCQDTAFACNIGWPDKHLSLECCTIPLGTGTPIYKQFVQDSNFKTCCVRIADQIDDEEKVACKHPRGDGWAGLFEYYYPTNALGWENERTSTMIASKDEVTTCINQVDSMMEGTQAVDWVSKAIERNQKMAAGESPAGVTGSTVRSKVQEDIKDVRPKDKALRFSDSLQGEGLTLRINFPSMELGERTKLAEHFCMHPLQFHKLLGTADLLQREGGNVNQLKQIPIWSNYCEQGVELMTNPSLSNMVNIDGTDTDFTKGMAAWEQDPLYCQRINSLANENMAITKIKDVIDKSPGRGRTAAEVGYTCSQNGKLNGGMVPVSLYRHAAVERRTAISDHALGFLIAGGMWERMRAGNKSYYKRFEPRPYSWQSAERIFKGKRWAGGGSNELLMGCKSYGGRNYQGQDTSDQLFISNFTHQAFTQEPIVNVNTKDAFDKYVQEWATGSGKKTISRKGVDKDAHNYAAAFRKFATCPAGFVRWNPPPDEVELNANLALFCGEENFGSPTGK